MYTAPKPAFSMIFALSTSYAPGATRSLSSFSNRFNNFVLLIRGSSVQVGPRDSRACIRCGANTDGAAAGRKSVSCDGAIAARDGTSLGRELEVIDEKSRGDGQCGVGPDADPKV